MPFVKILYVSTLCSEETLNKLFSSSKSKQSLAAQKFHKLIVEGFNIGKHNVNVLSSLPISRNSHSKLIWKGYTEEFGKLSFHYLFFINFPIIRHIFLFLGSFFYTLSWCVKNKTKDMVVICDVLNITISLAARMATKITGTRTIGIVTDLQKNMGAARNDNRNTKIIPRLITAFSDSFISSFDMYVMLTQAMNELVNPKNKPYIIMEGLVDINMKDREHQPFDDKEKIIIYAGGIYEKYGVRKLIDAFYSIKVGNIKLYIYGPGEMEKDMEFLMDRDKRLIYHGIVPNEVVVMQQLKATLLINPRPSSNEFTKYSFPSKNLEYMVSGTPLLTTPLPGMPEEYDEFVYLIENETTEGIQNILTELLNKQINELCEFGKKAKAFVLNNKNNLSQSERIINLFRKN